jgi:hypothetical protein
MRNVVEYPITYGEACEVLQEAQEEYRSRFKQDNVTIGGITGVTLFLIEQFIHAHKNEFEEFTKTLPKKNNE